MIVAEIHGKIPSFLEDKEDVLTSNVFSFFKYSNRKILKEYLNILGINISLNEAQEAEFNFWPKFEDGTEPDLIINCGKYYLLFEAKLYSDFTPKTKLTEAQIEREIKMGKLSAHNLNKEFVFIAVTAEYYRLSSKYSKYINNNNGFSFIWTNWQQIATFIENKVDSKKNEFANDLHSLLLKKRLRSYDGLLNIYNYKISKIGDFIFYNYFTSDFKGEFTGFISKFLSFKKIEPYQKILKRSFFKKIKPYNSFSTKTVFYYGK